MTNRATSDKLSFGAQAEVGNLGYTKFGFNVSKKDGNIGLLIGYDRIQANNNYAYSIPSANFSGTRTNNDATYNNLGFKLSTIGKLHPLKILLGASHFLFSESASAPQGGRKLTQLRLRY